MMKTDRKTYVRFDDMTWPLPQPELSHKLRYSSPSLEVKIVKLSYSDLLHAATIMDAYESLINSPKVKRDKVIRELRKAIGD